MTNITIYKNSNNQVVGFKSIGHAGYAKAGKDIVCAAVSTLTINTINSIESLTDDRFEASIDEKHAIMDFKLIDISEKSEVLLDSLVLGLEGIREGNSKYISITFEEV
ncbi:MAG: ribosomal-processing cysteine protease Prp [Lachnospira sp.]|nr:ribosomal-processing cysteine protease Prp [Lachnospira sp.]